VVTSAAVIMVAVFSIFATLSIIDLKMIGVGLAAAVLIDATVVRGILMPAALTLCGERTWYFPSWLAWLPGRNTLEHATAGAAEPAGAGAALAPGDRPVAAVRLAGEPTGSRASVG
jgi:RND superfamily putative drug exporter